MNRTFHFDDAEGEGLSKTTSHPTFTAHFSDEFYYDCVDDEAPFGSDGGADTLCALEAHFLEDGTSDDLLEWLFDHFDGNGFELASRSVAFITDSAKLAEIDAADEFIMNELDETIIAAAFGLIKITGQVDPKLKDLALLALQRRIDRYGGGSIMAKAKQDLKQFAV